MIEAICPKCHTINLVGDELMGRYMLCEKCRCRFYVNVPPLGEQLQPVPPSTGIQESPARETTLDDLLWDTQQGEKYVIRAIFEPRTNCGNCVGCFWACGNRTGKSCGDDDVTSAIILSRA